MADSSGEPPVRRVNAPVLVIGLLLGVLLSWLSFAMLLVILSSAAPGAAAVVGALVLPALVGAVLLSQPRTRQAGAGFLMGVAIGLITGAGVCGATAAALA